jgi:hypothetical protein
MRNLTYGPQMLKIGVDVTEINQKREAYHNKTNRIKDLYVSYSVPWSHGSRRICEPDAREGSVL